MDVEKYKKEVVMPGLQSLPIGQIVEMEQTVNPKNRELFIEILKELINDRWGWEQGWIMEMNSAYLKYRKIAHGFKQTPQEANTSDLTQATEKTGTYPIEPEIMPEIE